MAAVIPSPTRVPARDDPVCRTQPTPAVPAQRRADNIWSSPATHAPDTGIQDAGIQPGTGRPESVMPVVWTADCSATVELARLAGPRDGTFQIPGRLAHPSCPIRPCDLDRTECITALYTRCLTVGNQFEIYQWVNLDNLVELWDKLVLPVGVKAEWAGALHSMLRQNAPAPRGPDVAKRTTGAGLRVARRSGNVAGKWGTVEVLSRPGRAPFVPIQL